MFHSICLMFHYTSWHFYAFSRTNLLTSHHSASSLFSAIFVFRQSYTGNILGIGRNQSQSPKISPKLPENQRGVGVGPRGEHTPGRRRPGPGRAPLCVRPPRSTLNDAPSPIKTPRREKPKYPISFPEHIAIRHRHWPEDREGPEAHPGTLPERGIATRGLLHRHACLRSDEWVVYLGLRVHNSSKMVVSSTMCFMFRSHEVPYMIEITVM
jgi:hypothetical protein